LRLKNSLKRWYINRGQVRHIGIRYAKKCFRNGKGGKRRFVFVNHELREHFRDYFKWKQSIAESTEHVSSIQQFRKAFDVKGRSKPSNSR